MYHVLRISAYFQKPFIVMLRRVIAQEERKPLLYDKHMLRRVKNFTDHLPDNPRSDAFTDKKGDDHFEIINKLARSRYIGFFAAGQEGAVEHFIMETADATVTASVPAFIRVVGKAENVYRCNVVSPPNQRHLYVYMRQDSAKNDRGILIFHADEDIQGVFACGSGLMLSTDRKSGEKRIQWVAIVRMGHNDNSITAHLRDERLATSVQKGLSSMASVLNDADLAFSQSESIHTADDLVGPVLRENLPSPNGFYLDFACLKDRQATFYQKTYKKLADLCFVRDWKAAHAELNNME